MALRVGPKTMAQDLKKKNEWSFLTFANNHSVTNLLVKHFTNSKNGEEFSKLQLATKSGKYIFLNMGPSLKAVSHEKELGPMLKDLEVMELPVKATLKRERKSKGYQQETFIIYRKGNVEKGMSLDDLMAMCEE